MLIGWGLDPSTNHGGQDNGLTLGPINLSNGQGCLGQAWGRGRGRAEAGGQGARDPRSSRRGDWSKRRHAPENQTRQLRWVLCLGGWASRLTCDLACIPTEKDRETERGIGNLSPTTPGQALGALLPISLSLEGHLPYIEPF